MSEERAKMSSLSDAQKVNSVESLINGHPRGGKPDPSNKSVKEILFCVRIRGGVPC
jgi:hypothetical protein